MNPVPDPYLKAKNPSKSSKERVGGGRIQLQLCNERAKVGGNKQNLYTFTVNGYLAYLTSCKRVVTFERGAAMNYFSSKKRNENIEKTSFSRHILTQES